MENQEYTKRNNELFVELAKYPEDSQKYQDIVSKIVKNNVRLVTSVAKNYLPIIKSTVISLEDLISEGYFGLLRAIKTFKLEKGVTFATYAVYKIKSYILSHLRREVRRLTDSLEDDRDGDTGKLKDDLVSPVNLEEDFAEKDETDRQLAWVRKNIDKLPPRQKDVLIAKYLSGETMLTDEALAEEFDCTHQNISEAEKNATKKLKKIYYAAHPEEIEPKKEEIELTREEKIKLKEVLKNLILTELQPQQKKVMLCKFYAATEKTNEQVAQEINLAKQYVSRQISMSYKKLCKLCDSVRDKNHLKSILEFRIEDNGKAC